MTDALPPFPSARLAGIDGCPAGWIVCLVSLDGPLAPEIRVISHLADLLDHSDAPLVGAIDMPIGLPDRVGPRGRAPDREARSILGPRQSSVFSMPSRAAVFAGEGLEPRAAYAAACATALATSDPPRKVSKQGFALFPRIREIDRWLDPARAERLIESHPEVAFAVLAGAPMSLPKKVKSRPNPAGLDERRAVLAAHGFDAEVLRHPPRGAGPDDLIDACVLALVARRLYAGTAVSFPDPPERDGRGLPVAIRA